MSDYTIIYPKGYKKNNKNIIAKVEKDLLSYGTKISNRVCANYLFQGVVGCGKTTLAKAIYTTCWLKGRRSDSKATSFRKMYEDYLSLMSSTYSDKYDAIKELSLCTQKEVLFLDDLGDEKPNTDAAHDYIGGLLEKRYEHIKTGFPENKFNCVTIITTNLNGKQIIDTYGSRVYDRLQEVFVICKFKEVSFREKKRQIIEG